MVQVSPYDYCTMDTHFAEVSSASGVKTHVSLQQKHARDPSWKRDAMTSRSFRSGATPVPVSTNDYYSFMYGQICSQILASCRSANDSESSSGPNKPQYQRSARHEAEQHCNDDAAVSVFAMSLGGSSDDQVFSSLQPASGLRKQKPETCMETVLFTKILS